MNQKWVSSNSIEQLRAAARAAAQRVAQSSSPKEPAMELWRLGLGDSENSLAGGLWQIWGRITDEWTHPEGDELLAARLARESAAELTAVLGDEDRERAYCDRWIYERLDIVLPDQGK